MRFVIKGSEAVRAEGEAGHSLCQSCGEPLGEEDEDIFYLVCENEADGVMCALAGHMVWSYDKRHRCWWMT